MMRKRSICWILVICMILSLLPARPAAAEKEPVQTTGTYGQLTYAVHDGYVEITDCDESATVIRIPSVIDGLPVTQIGHYAFFYCRKLSSVILSENTEHIGDGAFGSCDLLTSIDFPDSLRSIGSDAFYSCNSLAAVFIPAATSTIKESVFSDCDALQKIQVDEKNEWYASKNGVLFTRDGTGLISYPCGRAGSYTVPDGTVYIESGAFYGAKSLHSIVLPESLTELRYSVFSGCSMLRSINIPSQLSSIPSHTFYDCSALEYISIPETVTEIGQYAFFRSSLKEIILPPTLKSIDGYAFAKCNGLTSVRIPDSVEEYWDGAFSGCQSLLAIEVSEQHPYFCSIDGVLFDKQRTALMQYPAGKTGSYTVPDGVQTINYFAFEGCNGLVSIYIPDSVEEVRAYAFEECQSLLAIEVTEQNPYFCSIDGVLFNKQCTTLMKYPIGKTGSYAVPDGVQMMSFDAFDMCTTLCASYFIFSIYY